MSDQSQLAPHNVESEKAVLGTIIGGGEEALDRLAQAERHIHSAEDFFLVRHGWIWDAMIHLRDQSMPIDHLTVVSVLERHGQLSEVGGAAYIIGTLLDIPYYINVEGYARIVAEMSYRRRMISVAQNIARAAHSEKSLVEIHYEVSKEWSSLAGPQAHVFATSRAMMDRHADRMLGRFNGDTLTGGYSTGLTNLDRAFGGDLNVGVYSIVLGPTGVGKTWLMLQMSLALARQLPVVYISLENIEESLSDRMVALETKMAYSFVKSGKVNGRPMPEDMRARIYAAEDLIATLPFELVEHFTKASEIRSHLQAATIRHGRPGICFVDTLNQLADAIGKEDRYQNLTKASAQLLQTMRLTGWGIVAGAQMKLNLEAGMTRKKAKQAAWPTKKSLEGARTVVQHVRNMVGLYSPDYVAREINDPGYVDPDCMRGHVLAINVKGNENDGKGEGEMAWHEGIPIYSDPNVKDLNEELDKALMEDR